MRKFLLILMVMAICGVPSPASADATANRINGVAEFLLERANDNLTYVLQRNIRANRLMQCYFPQTYAHATANNLTLLLQAGPEVWRRSVEADLESLGVHLFYSGIGEPALRKWLSGIRNAYILLAQQLVIVHEGREYRLDFIPLDADPEVRDAINEFYATFLNAERELEAVLASTARDPANGECPVRDYLPAEAAIDRTRVAFEGLGRHLSSIGETVIRTADGSEIDSVVLAPLSQRVAMLTDVSERVRYYTDAIARIKEVDDVVVRTMELDRIVRESIEAGENPFFGPGQLKDYEKFSRYALSFAMLSAADSTEQVKSVMRQLTVPPVSFASKREPGRSRVMVTAYFGGQGGRESGGGGGFGGLSVPVGLEYTRGLDNGSVSIMFAPLDFAHPVNQVINDSEASASLRDLVNPGVYVSYGLRDYPIVIGLGVTRGRAVTMTQNGNETRVFAFVALDMPLFNIW